MSMFTSVGLGDIWSIPGLTGMNFSSPIGEILDRESFTLEELLQEDELLQEVKSRNGRLLEFLTQEEIMCKIINYLIIPANPSDGDLRIFKYPYMSCELLCCEIPDILHILVEDCEGKYLSRLFQIIESSTPLDHYLAGYFEKILEMLFRRMTIPVMSYLNNGGMQLMSVFLKHIYNYSIMQIVQRLLLPHIPFSIGIVDLDTIPAEERQHCQCNWSFMEESCDLLCTTMLQQENPDVPSHVSDLLITVIQLSPPYAKFICHLCEPQCLNKLFAAAFADCAEAAELSLEPPNSVSSLSLAAISVLESMVSRLSEAMNPFDTLGNEMTPDQLQLAMDQLRKNTENVCAAIIPCIPQASRQLQNHVFNQPCGEIACQAGGLVRRLGHRALQIVKLVESILRLNNAEVDDCLCSQGVIKACIDLMFLFELNSLLHLAVQRIVLMLIEAGASRRSAQRVLFGECDLLRRTIETIRLKGADQAGSRDLLANSKKPALGHIIQIAQCIVAAIQAERDSEQKKDMSPLNDDERAAFKYDDAMADEYGNPGRSSTSLQDVVAEFISLEDWNAFVEVELRGVLDVQSSHVPEFESAPPACIPGEISSGLAASLAIDDDDESFESPLSDKDLGDLEASLQAIEFQDRVANDRNQRRNLRMAVSYSSLPQPPSSMSGDPNNLEGDEDEDDDYHVDDTGMDGATFDGVFENDIEDRVVPPTYISGETETNFADFDFAQFDNATGLTGSGNSPGFDFEAFFPSVKTDVSSSFEDVFSSSEADINLMSDDIFANFPSAPEAKEKKTDDFSGSENSVEAVDVAIVLKEEITDASQDMDVFNQSSYSSLDPNLNKET